MVSHSPTDDKKNLRKKPSKRKIEKGSQLRKEKNVIPFAGLTQTKTLLAFLQYGIDQFQPQKKKDITSHMRIFSMRLTQKRVRKQKWTQCSKKTFRQVNMSLHILKTLSLSSRGYKNRLYPNVDSAFGPPYAGLTISTTDPAEPPNKNQFHIFFVNFTTDERLITYFTEILSTLIPLQIPIIKKMGLKGLQKWKHINLPMTPKLGFLRNFSKFKIVTLKW